jgi:hypothetical protein
MLRLLNKCRKMLPLPLWPDDTITLEAKSVERSKADSFTAYLEAKQRLRATAAVPSGAGSTPLSLLFTVAEAPQAEMKLVELQAASGLPFDEFAGAVKNLTDLGYLGVAGPPGNEIVTLTKLGQDVSRLARQRP